MAGDHLAHEHNSEVINHFLPHGYCFEWQADILWLNVISDIVIATAYFSIPFILVQFLKKRPDIKFRGIFVLFAAFILLCGLTHAFAIYVIWHPEYAIHGTLKALTALVSIGTAYVLFKNFDQAISIPTREELESAIKESEVQRFRSEQLEREKRSQAIFKFTTELIPAGLMVIDANQKIIFTNEALNKTFGYETGELEKQPLSILLETSDDHHRSLVHQYMTTPTQSHRMAAGRVVRGKHKSGKLVDIQISLSVHEYEGEKHAFAVINDFGSFITKEKQYSELSGRVIRAIEASNEGVWEWNVQTNEVWYSPRLLEMIGHQGVEKGLFSMWQGHIHPEDWPLIEQTLDQHLRKQSVYDISYRGLTEKGDYEWFHVRGNTLFDTNNNPLLMSGTLSNINHVKQLETKLRNKTDFLNKVLERSLTGIYIFDLNAQRNTYINPEYTHLTGYTLEMLEELQQTPDLMPLFHPDDVQAIFAHIQEIASQSPEEQVGLGIEYRFRHKDGSWRWFYSKDSVYSFDDQGRPKEMLGAFFDITQLKERESQIRKLANDYSTTFEQAGLGIAHVSIDGRFIKTNQKLQDIFGYSESEFEAMSFADVTYKEDIQRGYEAIQRFKAGEISLFDIEKRYVRKDGEVFWAHLTTTIVNETDEKPYYISIIEDISSRKEMESKLSESNAALERFAYSASHDLQEPLRKINAFSELLGNRLAGKLDDPEARFQLNRICESASRMSELIDNLLELSKASRAKPDLRQIKLRELINIVVNNLSTRFEDKSIEIHVNHDIDLWVDEHAFEQIFQNLIVNSINYASPERAQRIHIDVLKYSSKVRLLYRDFGMGIPLEQLEEVFEPFRRLIGKEIPGTGMGLAICRQLVKAHKGRIWAEQPEDRIGTLFIIELPLNPNFQE